MQIDWSQHLQPLGTLAEEVVRILSLPYIAEGVARCPDRDAYAEELMLPSRADKSFKLHANQVDGIWTFDTYGGLLGPIGVGRGKSILAMMSAVLAVRRRGHRRVCIMIPPEVFSQFTMTDLPHARSLLNFMGVAFRPVVGSASQRMEVAKESGAGVWIYSYSSLSAQNGEEELKRIGATCYVLDEAHNLARAKAARTKRWHAVLRQLEQEGVVALTKQLHGDGPMTGMECLALSGTITKKSLIDYAHLSARTLREMAPTPFREMAVKTLGLVIDSGDSGWAGNGANTLGARDQGTICHFVDWAKRFNLHVDKSESGVPLTWREQVQNAFRARLNSSPGVITTGDSGVGSSLVIHWHEPARPDTLESHTMIELMKRIINQGLTPGGDTIDFAMHQYKWLWELSAGFYNNLVWPSVVQVKDQYPLKYNKAITEAEAEALLQQAKYHHDLLQVYHKELRKFLDGPHNSGCDTPMLVAAEIMRQLENPKYEKRVRFPTELIQAYTSQRAQGTHVYPDLPERFSTPVRVCDYKIQAACDWAAQHEEGFIWYHHPVIGKWVSEMLTERGISHTLAEAGMNDKAFIPGLVVASYSHGTGKNLQHQCLNYFIELRREASVMEQTLGRTHRSGQKADVVEAFLAIGNGFDLALFNGILKDADYAQSTTGQVQRLCFASYDPVVPPTNPRLMLKLGIIKNLVSATQMNPWTAITPPDTRIAADLFRPVALAAG